MNRRWIPLALVTLVVVAGLASLLSLAPVARAGPYATGAVTGKISGPTAIAVQSTHIYYVNGSGGPAVGPDGNLVGNLTWYATVVAADLTGVSITPTSSLLLNGTPGMPRLSVGNVSELVTIEVEISSVYGTQNDSVNLTYQVDVVVPYELTAVLQAGPSATVLPFTVAVTLDGVNVGTAKVPTLLANQTYTLTFDYATASLSEGWHTFRLSLAQEHGLVTFAGGATSFATSFYVTGPPPNYTVWYVAGVVAFFGALFIFATRVAARRRGAARR